MWIPGSGSHPHMKRSARAGRVAAAATLALAMTSVLAGCTAAGGGGAPAADDGVVTVLDPQTDENGSAALQATLDTCSEQTGYKIERTTVPLQQLVQQVLLSASSKSLQDLISVDTGTLEQLAQSGALAELSSAGISGHGYYPGVVSSGSYDGKLYALAPGAVSLAIFYNKDLLQAAGVEPPTTWDELRTVGAALSGGDKYGLAISGVGEEGSFQFLPWLWSNGGDLSELDSPEAIEALDYWKGLVDDGIVSRSAVNWTQDDVMKQFLAGNAAMMENGNWQLPGLEKAGMNYGIVNIPLPSAGAEQVSVLGGTGWALAAPAAKDKAAAEVLKCLTSDEVALQWSKGFGLVPAVESMAADFIKEQPAIEPFVEAVATGKNRAEGLEGKYAAVSSALQGALQAALSGTSSAKQAMDAAQQQAEQD